MDQIFALRRQTLISNCPALMIKRLLALKGIHYFVTRFGWEGLRSRAFDGKYERGDWSSHGDGKGELPAAINRYLRQGDLLIMGCGGASVLDGLQSPGFTSALGVDLSPEAIRLAGRFAAERVTFQVADMESFQCPKPLDVILFSESIYYVPASRQVALLQRLSASLKPGGVFIVTLAEAVRYAAILARIRESFTVLEDRPFPHSSRQLIVFSPQAPCPGQPHPSASASVS